MNRHQRSNAGLSLTAAAITILSGCAGLNQSGSPHVGESLRDSQIQTAARDVRLGETDRRGQTVQQCGYGCPCGPGGTAMHGGTGMPGGLPPEPYGIDRNEFLCNGYDMPPRAYLQRDDSIGGVAPTDVAVSYTTEDLDVELATSNRVCVYAPRFASVRKITGAIEGEHAVGLAATHRDVILGGIAVDEGGIQLDRTVELGHADVAKRLDAIRERNRGVPVDLVVAPVQQVDILPPLANIRSDSLNLLTEEQSALLRQRSIAATTYTVDQLVDVAILDVAPPAITRVQAAQEFVIYEFPEAGRLEVLKVVDKLDAAPGEQLTFTITARNVGDSPVSQIRLADSLTTRLEYIDDSQTASLKAAFSTVANEAGSVRLIWQFAEPLKVGETITISFRCQVR